MTLEFGKFKTFATDFASISSKLGDEWVLRTSNIGKSEEIYLEKRIIKTCNEESEIIKDSDNCDGELEISNPKYTVFVYHIIYSHSYSVPVLWFTAHHEDGKLLSLEELWKQIPSCFKNSERDSKWNTLTQQEHPILGIPYFMLHPCYTADLLSACHSSNYIISWLSIVGPVAGLTLSLNYAKYT